MGLDFLRRIDLKGVLIVAFLSVLAFVGTSILVLGLLMREWILIVPGIPVAFLVHRPLFKLRPLAALLGALVMGTLSGMFLGDWTRLLFGIVAGTLWGAFIGLVLSVVLLSMFTPGLELGLIKIDVLPYFPIVGVIIAIFGGLGMIAGAVLGFMYLREGIANLYGPLGGGIMLGWSIGAVIAYRLRYS
jgi:hypothetical protein